MRAAEMQVEPEAAGFDLRSAPAMLRRRRWWFVGAAAIILAGSIALAFGLSPVYRSQATILIEQQEIPQDMVRSAVTSFADQRVQIISQRVMTRSNLIDIIRKFDLYPEDVGKEPTEVLISRMRKDINLGMVSADVMDPRSGRPTQATIAFTLAYNYFNPVTAQKVTNELTTLYLNENVKNRTQMAAGTSAFLAEEADKLARQIQELEKSLASFKTANAGMLPELSITNQQMLDRIDRDLMNVEQQMRALEERRIYIESELTRIDPAETLYNEAGQRIMSPAERLRVLRTRLLSLQAVYSADHPDVVRTRKEVEALAREVGTSPPSADAEETAATLVTLHSDLTLAREKYSPDHPDVKRLERTIAALAASGADAPASDSTASFSGRSVNPVYVEMQARLEATQAELRSLARSRDELRARMADYERRLTHTPEVERDYRNLLRDYDSTQIRYRDTRARLMEAQLSKSLELERKGERFTLIEPPTLPETPLSPNRKAILFAGLILALAAGAGMVLLREKTDDSVWSGDDYKGPVYGVSAPLLVPYIANDRDVRMRKLRIGFTFAFAIVAVISTALSVHLLHTPLDVLWFSTARRLGS